MVKAWTGAPLPCLIADRAYDGDAFRAWLAQRGIEAVLPARRRRLNLQLLYPERYKARNKLGERPSFYPSILRMHFGRCSAPLRPVNRGFRTPLSA